MLKGREHKKVVIINKKPSWSHWSTWGSAQKVHRAANLLVLLARIFVGTCTSNGDWNGGCNDDCNVDYNVKWSPYFPTGNFPELSELKSWFSPVKEPNQDPGKVSGLSLVESFNLSVRSIHQVHSNQVPGFYTKAGKKID